MKKIILGLMVCAFPFLLAGCGNKKTVKCEGEDDGVKMTIEMKYDTKKGEFISAKEVIEYKYDDMDDKVADYIKENIDDACDDDDETYKSCKVKDSKKGATITAEIDPDKLNERYEDKDLDDIIESIESDDITCKVK